MNLQKQILKTVAATAVLSLLSAGPAQAFSFSFNNSGIRFSQDTKVTFNFLESHNGFRSDFGFREVGSTDETKVFEEVRNSDYGGWKDSWGTCGITVLEPCTKDFILKANTDYELFLTSNNQYNELVRDLSSGDQVKFFQGTSVLSDLSYTEYETSPDSLLSTTAGIQDANPFDGEVLIAFDDTFIGTAGGHIDYNDFLVTATAETVAVPEPATLAGLGLVLGAMALSRRRKEDRAS